ncbi:MAG: L-histidine N-alpha-methyltransferase [Sphingobacteriales bacterium]|jgi:L-histidine N-alpha-methyltransferase
MNQFERDIIEGLSQTPKTLPSRYFYDKRGDALFQQIMKMPEYYLTNSEFEIFQSKKEEILRLFSPNGEPFNLIEFGAGDGTKTKILLNYFVQQNADFTYKPIDISSNAIEQLSKTLLEEIPELKVKGVVNEYFSGLEEVSNAGETRNVVLFLGSNIGNFTPNKAQEFLSGLNARLNAGDLFFMGVDLMKDPHQVLAAYNDPAGITKAFNINLLYRMNQELGADFETLQFDHFPIYNPLTGETKSFLISRKAQEVEIKKLGMTFTFEANEAIHMEISQKYSLKRIEEIAADNGFEIEKHLFDCKHYYVDTVWKKQDKL